MKKVADSAMQPRLTLRIGVTGHRPNKLSPSQQQKVEERAGTILDCLAAASTAIHRANQDVFSADHPDLRLVTSLAEGADTVLARAAHARAFRLDIILPFHKDMYSSIQDFSAEALAEFESILQDPSTLDILELDGDLSSDRSMNAAYEAAGRRMLAHSDILFGVWNGEEEAGIGGTAQIMREAIDSGVRVIWITPDGEAFVVTDRSGLSGGAGLEPVFSGSGTCSNMLSQIVHTLLEPPAPDTDAGKALRRFIREPEREGSHWSAYNLMRSLLTGRHYSLRVDYALDADTEASWTRFRHHAQEIGGEAFSRSLGEKLETRWRRADNVAVHCSHAYRSAYVLNYFLAGLAVTAGLLSIFWWKHEYSLHVKLGFVLLELIFISIILLLTWLGGRDRNDWHVRWLDARTIAELLRSARLFSLVGSTAAPPSELLRTDNDAWIEWYARATLREIGLPTGRLDAPALRIAITSAIEDEIDGQIAYNTSALHSYRHIDHTLHIIGERLFKATFLIGIIFLVAGAFYLAFSSKDGFHLSSGTKDVIKAAVTIAGAVLPAFGAGLFGIRATGDFRLSAERATQTLTHLEALKEKLDHEKADPSRERISALFLTVTQALTSDLRAWSRIFRFRELSLPA